MPYRIRKVADKKRPYQIVNIQTGKAVGRSETRDKAQRSIEHRSTAEAKNIKSYKRSVDNKMHSYGETDLAKKTIRINKSKKKNASGDVIDTIVHEKEHILHPNKAEKNVRTSTSKKLKSMSVKQKQKHYNLFKG